MELYNYKTSTAEKLEGNYTDKEKVAIVVPLKYLSKFWRTPDMPSIDYEINLILTWSEKCVIPSKATSDADPANPEVATVNNPTNATF